MAHRPPDGCFTAPDGSKGGVFVIAAMAGRGQTGRRAHRADRLVRRRAEPRRHRPARGVRQHRRRRWRRTVYDSDREPRRPPGPHVERADHHPRRGPARAPGPRTDLLLVPGGEGARRPDPALVRWLRSTPARRSGWSRCAPARSCSPRRGCSTAGASPPTGRVPRPRSPRGLPARHGRPRPDLRPRRQRRPPRPASPPASTWRSPWSRTTSAATSPSPSPATSCCSCAGRATRPSSAPSSAAQLADREPLRELQRWIAEHPADDLLGRAARPPAACQPAHFARAFTAEVGHAPGPLRRAGPRSRPPAAASRTPPTASRRSPAAAASAPPRRCAAPSSAPSASAPAEYRRRFRAAGLATDHRNRPSQRRGPMDIAILLFDRFTALDAVGPYEVLSGSPAPRSPSSPNEPGPIAHRRRQPGPVADATLGRRAPPRHPRRARRAGPGRRR